MVKVKFRHLNDNNFSAVLAKLANETSWTSFQQAYNVSKLLRRIHKELGLARETHIKMLEQYAIKDEEGKYLAEPETPGGLPYKISDEKKDEYEKKMQEFLETEVEIDCQPIDTEELNNIKLTPVEITTIEPILNLQV